MINYTDINGCPKRFVAVTTLYESEFTEILSYFSERWRIHESRYTLSNTWRVNKPRKDKTLKLVEDKLLFILYYWVKLKERTKIVAGLVEFLSLIIMTAI